jgi:hypothetical protein
MTKRTPLHATTTKSNAAKMRRSRLKREGLAIVARPRMKHSLLVVAGLPTATILRTVPGRRREPRADHGQRARAVV